jgi:hypothetical protein
MGYLVVAIQIPVVCVLSSHGEHIASAIVISSAALCLVLTKYLSK